MALIHSRRARKWFSNWSQFFGGSLSDNNVQMMYFLLRKLTKKVITGKLPVINVVINTNSLSRRTVQSLFKVATRYLCTIWCLYFSKWHFNVLPEQIRRVNDFITERKAWSPVVRSFENKMKVPETFKISRHRPKKTVGACD